MIRINRVSRSFGGRAVLRDISFTVAAGECVSVIGPNGSGKSTLLRAIAGEIAPDAGHVEGLGADRIGYLRQAPRRTQDTRTPFPALALVLEGDALLSDAAAALAEAGSEELEAYERAYDELLTALEHVAPAEYLDGVARAMGADLRWFDSPADSLSGGEFAKLALLEIVAGSPDILLLDEPTNDLDRAGIDWLTDFISEFPGPVLTVSHDRAFLDAVSDGLVALDAEHAGAEVWHGDYTSWAREQARRRAEQEQAYLRERREERELRRTISAIESRSRNIEQRTIHFHYRKRAKKVARQGTVLKARLERHAASGERTERPDRGPLGVHAQFDTAPASASRLIEVADATVAIGNRVLVEHVDLVVERGARVVISGSNGSGKTTLLRALLGATDADRMLVREGTVHLAGSARSGWMQQHTAVDWPGATPLEVLRRAASVSEAEAGNLLHQFVLSHELAQQPIDALSEGERRRLQLAMLIASGANLLVLDEPTNHLDLPGREAFEAALEGFDGTVIAVSHDRYFADRFATECWAIEDRRVIFVTSSNAEG